MKDKHNIESLWRSTIKTLFVVAFGILLYELLENISSVRSAVSGFFSVITPIFIGIAIAFIANMPMHFLEAKVFRRWKASSLKRAVCLTLAMLFMLAILALLVVIIGPSLVDSVKTLAEDFDEYARKLTEWGTTTWENLRLNADIAAKLQELGENILTEIDQYISTAMSWAVKVTVNVAGIIVDLLFAFIISIYCLASKETLLRQARKLTKAMFNERASDKIIDVAGKTNTSLYNYLYGMITECFILGILCFIGMSIFKFPFALLISVMVGVGQIVPIVGAWFSAAVGTLIIFVVDPARAVWFLVLLLAIQQFEGNVIYPRVVGSAVGISGLWVMIALLLGGGLFGLLGAILCVPIMAVIHTLTREWVNRRLEEKRALGQDI